MTSPVEATPQTHSVIAKPIPLYLIFSLSLKPLNKPGAVAALEAWQRVNGDVMLYSAKDGISEISPGLRQICAPDRAGFFACLARSSSQGLVFLLSDDKADMECAAATGAIPLLLGGDSDPAQASFHAAIPTVAELERLLVSRAGAQSLLTLFEAGETTWTESMEQKAHAMREIIADRGVALFGTGTLGLQALSACRKAGFAVTHFVDNDKARQGVHIEGILCVGPNELARDVPVVVASGNFAIAILRQLQSEGRKHVFSLGELFYATREASQPEKDYPIMLYADRYKLLALLFLLVDVTSQEVLGHLIAYRKSLSPFDVERAKTKAPQWFDPDFFSPSPGCRFVDGGAYDGDTIAAFRKACPSYASITAFEPDETLARRCREKYQGDARIAIMHAALSGSCDTRYFEPSGFTAGRLNDGGIAVPATTLDKACAQGADFIKLDIEGEELNALSGAAALIRAYHPMFALAAYHKAEDLWLLPSTLMKLGEYRAFGLRHYTQSSFETVLYTLSGDTEI